MLFTDDPITDYDRYCNEQQKELDSLPRCKECKKPIQTEWLYEFDGEYICEDCMDEHKKSTDSVI